MRGVSELYLKIVQRVDVRSAIRTQGGQLAEAGTFRGTVSSIAPIATKLEEWKTERTVLVTTCIRNEHLMLKPEMTGNAKISCGERRLIDLLTRRLAHYLRVEFWSWW